MARSAEPPDVMAGSSPAIVRFGVFELDVRTRELRKGGLKVRLPDQPFHVLALLLEQPNDLVTREALHQRLWPGDTFVEFDLSLNSAVRKLREALGDSAESPTFIETLPRRGYRFIAPVQRQPPSNGIPTVPDTGGGRLLSRVRVWWSVAGLLAIVAAVAMVPRAGGESTNKPTPPSSPSPQTRAVSPEAYDLFLKGQAAGGRVSYEGNLAAVSYYEQAIAKQPDFAKAHASLALAHIQFLFGGPLPPDEILPKAEKEARTALDLDDTQRDARRALIRVLTTYGDHAAADAQVDLLAKAGPSFESLSALVESLIHHRRFPEAVAAAKQAKKLDGLSVNASLWLARAYRAAGDHAQAITEYQQAALMEPRRSDVLFQLGATFALKGDLKSAIAKFEQALDLTTTRNPRILAYLAYAHARDGRTREARQILEDLIASRVRAYVSSFGIALLYDALGEKDAALAALERASSEHAMEFTWLDAYPRFTTLASEPRYQELIGAARR